MSYWYAKKFKGVDLRKIGTKSVGASNAAKFVGKKASILVGLFDFAVKGAIPLLFLRYLGYEEWIQLSAGLLIVCGHNWSPFLGFRGGRGILTALGIILGLGMWIEFVTMCVVAGMIGRGLIYKDSGFWCFISFGLLPLLCFAFQEQTHIIIFSVLLVIMLLSKRLMSNGNMIREGSLKSTLLCRLVFDRDILSKTSWLKRG